MTEVDTKVVHVTGNVGMEVGHCTATDGETYTSRFSVIDSVFVNSRSRTGAWASVSSGQVTINCTSASDDIVDFIICGR